MRSGRYENAVELLQRVDRMQTRFVESSALLGQFFENRGEVGMAIARYADVIRNRPIDGETAQIHCRLAQLLAEKGHKEQAAALWRRVIAFDPSHKDAKEGLKLLGLAEKIAETEASLQAGDVVPLVLPGDEPGAVAKDIVNVAAVRSDFDLLRDLPIFSEISLDELRMMHTLADRVTIQPGEILIGQGEPPRTLYIIVSGEVKVKIVSAENDPRTIAVLGPGASVGEMGMVDEGPASARVTAVGNVTAFAFPIDRLNATLARDPRMGFKVLRVLGRILSTRLRAANAALGA
jgi:hypothetical protein